MTKTKTQNTQPTFAPGDRVHLRRNAAFASLDDAGTVEGQEGPNVLVHWSSALVCLERASDIVHASAGASYDARGRCWRVIDGDGKRRSHLGFDSLAGALAFAQKLDQARAPARVAAAPAAATIDNAALDAQLARLAELVAQHGFELGWAKLEYDRAGWHAHVAARKSGKARNGQRHRADSYTASGDSPEHAVDKLGEHLEFHAGRK